MQPTTQPAPSPSRVQLGQPTAAPSPVSSSPLLASSPNTDPIATLAPSNPPPTPIATWSQHGIFKPKRPFNLHTSTSTAISPLPKNPLSALHDPNWKAAMTDEFDALIKNKTWGLVPRHAKVNLIHSMWIIPHKNNYDGSFERYKARLVGDGRSQQVEVDWDEKFCLVVKLATIRTVLSIALSRS
ncbi:hypothetical protein BVRB_7g163040 [Beta vulgaris subsp. vulgaris]|nr:hypothetical protein BVRB_7g163040 [Beta vulgaris subsp. vulgaris]